MFLFPHGLTVDKDGNIWVTDGREPTEKAASLQVQPDGKVLMTLGKAESRGWSGHIQYAVRCSNWFEWRHFCRGRAWREQQQPHREVHEGWKIHQDVGKKGPAQGSSTYRIAWPSIRKDGCSSGIAITIGSRSSTGRKLYRGVEAIQPAERNFH